MKTHSHLFSFTLSLGASVLSSWSISAQCQTWVPSIRDGIGKSEPLCHALLKRMKDYSGPNSPDTRCSTWDMIVSYPDFTEPPWEELDPKEHKELLLKLMRSEFAVNINVSAEVQQRQDAKFRKRVDEFIKEGGHLRLWRAKPGIIYEKGSAPPKEQVFVQMGRDPEKSTLCVGTLHPPADWSRRVHVVLSDLSDLAPFSATKPMTKKALSNDSIFLTQTHGLFVYKGETVLIGSGGDVWRFSSGSPQPMCDFK